MILPLQVANGMFIARRALPGNPDKGILGVVDSGSNATCVCVSTRRRAKLEVVGEGTAILRPVTATASRKGDAGLAISRRGCQNGRILQKPRLARNGALPLDGILCRIARHGAQLAQAAMAGQAARPCTRGRSPAGRLIGRHLVSYLII